MHIGEFEEVVLLAIHGLGDDAYGVPIRVRLNEAGRKASVGALYVTLERLEAKGLITSRSGEPTAQRGGRAKIYFRLTSEGNKALSDAEQLRCRLRRNFEPSMA